MMKDIAAEYKKYFESSVMEEIARAAHGEHYCGQTSSATLPEILDALSQTSLPRKGGIMDAGCGNGCFALKLSGDYGYRLYGVDICLELVERASASAARLRLDGQCQFYHGDFTQPSAFDGQVDAVLCVGSLYWGPPLSDTFEHWKRMLGGRGDVIIFLNTQARPLSRQEQERVGKTAFIAESLLTDVMRECGFTAHLDDKTETYIRWLEKWCVAMRSRLARLAEELGEVQSRKMMERFETYLDLANVGKVKRNIIISSITQ